MGNVKALLVGINKYQHAPQLAGCVNDVETMRALIAPTTQDIVTLVDGQATAVAVQAALRQLFAYCVAGDVRMFGYSGHGTWVPDKNGDELDHRDECLCAAVDFSFDDPTTWLTDDVLARILRDAHIPAGVSVLISTDSCNSGTILRAVGGPRPKYIPSPWAEPVRATRGWRKFLGQPVPERPIGPKLLKATKAAVTQLSATRPTQYAADAYLDGKMQGAFTWAFRLALAQAGPRGPLAWVRGRMEQLLHDRGFGSQTPTCYGSKLPRKVPFLAPVV